MPAPTLPLETPSSDTRQPAAEAIRFENVSLAFDDKWFWTTFRSGCRTEKPKRIFGVAGSGKSTILKLALGLMKPDSGRIYVLGEEVTQMSEKDLFNLRRTSWNGVSGERAVRFAHGAGKCRIPPDRGRAMFPKTRSSGGCARP